MDTGFVSEFRYRRALANSGIGYGSKPDISFNRNLSAFKIIGRSIIFGLIAWGIIVAFELILVESHVLTDAQASTAFAQFIGLTVFFGYLSLPYLKILWSSIKQGQWLNFHDWQFYTRSQKILANLALAYLLIFLINKIYIFAVEYDFIAPSPLISSTIYNSWQKKSNSYHHFDHNTNSVGIQNAQNPTASAVFKNPIQLNNTTALALWALFTFLLSVFTSKAAKKETHSTIPNSQAKLLDKKALSVTQNLPFGLWLGQSTGYLSSLSHGVGMAPNQHVALFGDDAAQNILILGATGSGKTTRAVQPLLLQLFEQQCGGLIFDIKGDFYQTVEKLSSYTNRPYTVIGAQDKPFNLLTGLPPEIASSFLKSAFLLNGNHRHDSFWVDTATELCRNVLGVLSFLPQHYSLCNLYAYLFDESFAQDLHQQIDKIINNLENNQKRLLNTYLGYQTNIFSTFDEKVRAGVKATIAQVLAPFNHPELIDAFCTPHENGSNLEDVLQGTIFLINMPLSRWGLGGKVVYNFLKLRFFNIMQQRATKPNWNQDNFVFFLCDEYQEIVSSNKDGLSDLNFWDKSRSSKTIGIISTQSVSSFYAAIGDRDMSNALLQNFRQKICFRTEDQTTINLINNLLGTVEITRVTESENSGSSTPSLFGGGNSSTHQGQSTSLSTHDKPVLDGQFFRTLPRNHALVLLSLYGNGCDDVLKMEPLFI